MIRSAGKLPLQLGRIEATAAAIAALEKAGIAYLDLLTRHASGDWGDAPEGLAAENAKAVVDYEQVVSVYQILTTETILIVTEADRSSTAILLLSEA